MNALVTGGFGFIGSHLCQALSAAGHRFYIIDAGTYAAVNDEFVRALPGYIGARRANISHASAWDLGQMDTPDVVFNLAAETHVDRSLGRVPTTLAASRDDALSAVVDSNVLGAARAAAVCASWSVRLVHMSTDEVLGDAADVCGWKPGDSVSRITALSEIYPLRPSSPYSAGKAAAEGFIAAAVRSSGLDCVVLRPSNVYGARQTRDKIIPVAIRHLSRGRPVPLYAGGVQVRQWLHASDLAAALIRAVAVPAGTYNVPGPDLLTNRDLCALLRGALSRRSFPVPASAYETTADRPGHDVAYRIRTANDDLLGGIDLRRLSENIDSLIDSYV